MKLHNPVNPLQRVIFFKLAFFTLAAVFFCQSAPAQNATPRPIARLISNPAAESSRPRRASLESRIVESTPVKANEIELRAFEQTNKARVENGLAPLTWDDELCRLARAHSEHMALQKFFAHETPEGLRLRDRARANQIHFRLIGENIAYNKGYDDPGGFAVERWMISAGHRANILYAPFQSGAIGSYVAADGSTYLTQVFITR
jgi:uncharacterized protein YkwD